MNIARQAAFELAPHGILVNVVVPGPILGEVDGPDAGREDLDRYVNSVPLGRVGRPEDLEGVMLFLAGPGSSYVTGAVIAIDGGSLTRQNEVPTTVRR